jgi:hypothetical protein
MDNRGLKKRLIGAIFGPAIVPLVDIGPVQFVLCGLELMPLDTSVQHVQDIVKDLVEGEFRLSSTLSI